VERLYRVLLTKQANRLGQVGFVCGAGVKSPGPKTQTTAGKLQLIIT